MYSNVWENVFVWITYLCIGSCKTVLYRETWFSGSYNYQKQLLSLLNALFLYSCLLYWDNFYLTCCPAYYLLSMKANNYQELNELNAFRYGVVQKRFSVLLLTYGSHGSRKITSYSECVKNESFTLFYDKFDFSLVFRWQIECPVLC
jgi:hypothetical protein